jgi:hypothetical protein
LGPVPTLLEKGLKQVFGLALISVPKVPLQTWSTLRSEPTFLH